MYLPFADMVPRALHCIGLLDDADNSYTAVVNHCKLSLRKARAASAHMLADAATASAIFMKGAMLQGEQRLVTAYATLTPRSTSLIDDSLRARVIFDEWAAQLQNMSQLTKGFNKTFESLRGGANSKAHLIIEHDGKGGDRFGFPRDTRVYSRKAIAAALEALGQKRVAARLLPSQTTRSRLLLSGATTRRRAGGTASASARQNATMPTWSYRETDPARPRPLP